MMSSAEQSELRLFLENCKSKLFDINTVEAIHVVIGNEACDLDSVISALVYAYFLYQKNKAGRCLFVPVLNIPSNKYRLTSEVQFVLRQHDITGEQLVFRDDINLEELHKQQKLQLTLVDHNVLRGKDERLASAVCQVIDHHANEREESPSVSCYIEPVGSCCTLVTELILKDPDVNIPKELISLLHATILLDTVCLAESAGRTTAKDREVVEMLEEILGKVDRKKIFDQLQAAKMDVSGLSTKEILSKDVKMVSSCGVTVSVSSVPKSLKELFGEEQVDSILSEFSTQQGAAVVVIMALYLDQQREPHRELAVYSEDSLLKDKFISCLCESTNPGLGLAFTASLSSHLTSVYTQTNVTASRKQVLPLIVGLLKGMDDPDKQTSSDNRNMDTATGSGSDVGSNLGVTSSGDTAKEKKVRSIQKDEGQLQDPFDDHMHILLENNNDSTTSTTPASGLSSRSYSPANDGTEGQHSSAPGHMVRHLLPDVPANSPMETQGVSMMQGKHQELPSFNSIEMVQKIREKKSSYDGGDDEISKEVTNYPYTPTNSYADTGHMTEAAQKCVLPNFMNADIMQRIEEKKARLENIEHSSEGLADYYSRTDVSSFESSDVKTNIGGTEDSRVEQSQTASGDISDESVVKDGEILSEIVFSGDDENDKDVSDVMSDECALSVSRKHQHSVTINTETDQEISDQSADNPERKLTVIFSSDNLPSSAETTDGNQRTSEHRVLFTDDLHDNSGVSSSANNAKPSSYEQVNLRSKVKNVIRHDQGQDMTSEHIDTQAQGIVIYASSDKEAAQKFTESVIKTAIDEYKNTSSRLTTYDAVGDDVVSGNQNVQISEGVSLIRNVQNTVAKHRDNVLSPQTERSLYPGFETDENSTDDDSKAKTQDKAMDFVQDVIHEAIEVCRDELDGSSDAQKECLYHSPDGSSDAPEVNNEPTGGSTDDVTPVEEKDSPMKKDKLLSAKQRHHLEDVQKTLNISLDFSSEDEEEIKALKDQIPEDLISADNKPAERPTTLNTTTTKKKIMPSHDLLNDTDMDIPVSPISTDDDIGISVDDEKTPDDLTTPDVLNNSMFDGELDWQSTSSSTPVEPIPEYTAREELEDERHWRSVQIGEKWYKIDMKVIEPYKKVLSHGGYYGDGFNAIVVFTACYLPDRRRRDYHYVMDNLFLYVISTLELLVVEDYMIVYFHGATPRHKMPSLRWLKRCYDMIDRRLRKNLKGLLIVHPTIWLKTLVFMMKPFVSSKFSSKLRYIKNLEALTNAVPTEYIYIPEEVQKYDSYWSKSSSKESASST